MCKTSSEQTWEKLTTVAGSAQTHLLPPNLLKLFAPRPALPYLKPTGRDPDLPLKSLARPPPVLGIAETLQQIRDEREAKEAKDVEEGTLAKDEGEDEVNASIFTLTAEEEFKKRVADRKQRHIDGLANGIKTCQSSSTDPCARERRTS